MRRRLFLLAAPALAASPAQADERRYPVTDFDQVQVEGPFEVVVTTGASSSAAATGSARALEGVEVGVQGRRLRIRVNRSAWGGYPGDKPGPVRIAASTRELAGATVIGAGSLSVDRARSPRLDLSLGGTGRLTVGAIDVDLLGVNLLGSGKMILAGRAKQMRASVQGSGDLDGAGLAAVDIQLSAATAGTIVLGPARSAKIVATGAGEVTVGGSPACTVEARGAGSVRCGSR